MKRSVAHGGVRAFAPDAHLGGHDYVACLSIVLLTSRCAEFLDAVVYPQGVSGLRGR